MAEKTIYIDVLFVTNVIIDYFLLLITAKFALSPCSRWRLFCGSLMGGIFAVALFFWPYHAILTVPMQAIVCLTICTIAFNKPPLKDLIRLSFVFFAVTLAFGGVIFALSYFCNPRGLFCVSGGAAYINLPFPLLLFGTCGAYGLLGLVFGNGSMSAKPKPTKVSAQLFGKELEFFAMHDTGNLLIEPVSGKKVIILQKSQILKTSPPSITQSLLDLNGENAAFILGSMQAETGVKFTLVPYSCVGGTSLMLAIKPDLIKLNGIATTDYIIGISPQELNLGKCESAVINL